MKVRCYSADICSNFKEGAACERVTSIECGNYAPKPEAERDVVGELKLMQARWDKRYMERDNSPYYYGEAYGKKTAYRHAADLVEPFLAAKDAEIAETKARKRDLETEVGQLRARVAELEEDAALVHELRVALGNGLNHVRWDETTGKFAVRNCTCHPCPHTPCVPVEVVEKALSPINPNEYLTIFNSVFNAFNKGALWTRNRVKEALNDYK